MVKAGGGRNYHKYHGTVYTFSSRIPFFPLIKCRYVLARSAIRLDDGSVNGTTTDKLERVETNNAGGIKHVYEKNDIRARLVLV